MLLLRTEQILCETKISRDFLNTTNSTFGTRRKKLDMHCHWAALLDEHTHADGEKEGACCSFSEDAVPICIVNIKI